MEISIALKVGNCVILAGLNLLILVPPALCVCDVLTCLLTAWGERVSEKSLSSLLSDANLFRA